MVQIESAIHQPQTSERAFCKILYPSYIIMIDQQFHHEATCTQQHHNTDKQQQLPWAALAEFGVARGVNLPAHSTAPAPYAVADSEITLSIFNLFF